MKLQCSHFVHSPPKRAPCVIYLHGNCGCRLDAFESVGLLLRDGMTVFCFDFSGSGLSEGRENRSFDTPRPSGNTQSQETGKYISLGYYERKDVQTVVDYLRTVEYVSTIGMY